MDIKYKLDLEGIVNFHMNHMKNSVNFIIIYKQNTLMALSSLLLWFVVAYDIVLKISVLIYVCLYFLLMKKRMLRSLKRAMEKIYLMDSHKNYFENTTLSTQEDGIVLTTTYVEKQFKWKALRNIYQIDEFIFIRTYTNDHIYIPSKAVEIKNILDIILSSTNLQLEKSYPEDMAPK